MIKVIYVISDTNIGGAGKCVLTFLKYYDRSKINLKIILPQSSLLIPKIRELGGVYIEIEGIGRLTNRMV